ncbi:pyridoxal phosphate-dependent aminotransferase [Patulibacter minatonensis]|uniref:pyridoxal phosphate-dependent aminotransferase n=1 Tax=Patulibacter minatonensis TaxID=298163 RepID=UPI0004B2F2F7|nr:histidinol-phosphate transaminase [Patulibacter minatonensis]
MGFLRYYRQFEGLTEEEVNRGLRERAQEERGKALARVEPLDLARTTWHELPPAEVVSAITFHARKGLNRYAEGRDQELREALAVRHGVDASRVVVGEGAAGLLTRAAHELLAPGDEVVVPWPGYPLYPLLARDTGATAVRVAGLDPELLLAAVTPRTRMIVLGGPNDPTGELLPAPVLAELLARLPDHVVVVLDEALREFVTAEPVDAALRLTDRFARLLVVRSFSKAWGLAGLRCGYAVAGPGGQDLLRRLAPRLGSSDLALAGALAAVRSADDVLARRVRENDRERRTLTADLEELGLLVHPSQSATLWVRSPDRGGGALHAHLERSGVLVQSGLPLGDEHHVRIAVRGGTARPRLLRALGQGTVR